MPRKDPVAWRKANKDKWYGYYKKWQQRNKPKINADKRLWRSENKEHCLAWRRAYQAKNRERLRKWNREYREKNKDRLRANVRAALNARKAYVKRATPKWANQFFIKEIYHAAQLRNRYLGGKWDVDHIVPLQGKTVCGLHVENNMQLMLHELNVRKQNSYWPDMP